MSLAAIQTYKYQAPLSGNPPIHFEIEKIALDKSCVANRSHRSDLYKIFFLEEGQGQYAVDFNEFTLKRSGLFFLSPGQVLSVEAEKVKTAYLISFNREFYCVETHGKEIACNGVLFNNVHRATFLQLQEGEETTFKHWITQIINELSNPGKAHRDLLDTYLRMLLIEALRINESHQPLPSPPQDNSSQLAADFIALVDKHFRTKRTVSEYADMLFVSPKSIAKRLKLHGHATPTELIRNRITLEAKRELRYTQKSIKEIAFDLGFDDPAYFTRYFKKAENASPQAYRDQYL